MSLLLARFAFWRRFEKWGCARVSIRHQAAKCWQGAASTANRKDAVLAAQPIWGGEGVRLLGDGKLPRELRALREQWHFVQSRKSAPRRNLRHAENLACSRRDQTRPAKGIVPRHSRCKTRLGICTRVRGRDVANPSAWRRGRFCAGHWRNAHRA